MEIIEGKLIEAQKVVIYGPEGIGKSTLASQFPNPIFIDTEGSTRHLNVRRLKRPSSFTMLTQQIDYIKNNSDICNTLIIDTADWAEMLCKNEFCSKKQISGIEDIGYGKGYVYLAEDFGRMLNLLEEIRERGINVVITAHAVMRKFEQPDELGSYDRWELKLEKKVAPLLKEWADMLLFVNFKTYVINVDDKGAQKGKNKAQGGKRVMYATHHPCWDAKNRHDLPDEMPLEYSAIAHCIPIINTCKFESSVNQTKSDKVETSSVGKNNMSDSDASGISEKAENIPEDSGIPKALKDLMDASDIQVTIEDIQDAVSSRGYYPEGTPISNYAPEFIDGCLIGAWGQVLNMIKERKTQKNDFMVVQNSGLNEIPFNTK